MAMKVNGIEAVMVEDSYFKDSRICTMQLRYHRYIHSELLTHRMFSRNASSSRAIPVSKMLSQVWNDPAMPTHWGANQAGMQAKRELSGIKLRIAKFAWKMAAKMACGAAWIATKVGLHKQVANRILEPWQFIHVIVTATEWDNFFLLRDHPDAQPEIKELARLMKKAMNNSVPTYKAPGEWHLPYIRYEEQKFYSLEDCIKMSVARCARVSYLTHDGKNPSPDKDLALHDKLVVSEPLHASPAEHQASPGHSQVFYKNFRGWQQYRSFLENKTPVIRK